MDKPDILEVAGHYTSLRQRGREYFGHAVCHKDRSAAIHELPDVYLNWILENVDLKGGLFRALSEEFERRGSVAA